jgi:hypothetical protein
MAERKRQLAAAPNKSGSYIRGKTRGGSEVRVYADDGGGDYPVHGAWWYEAEKRWIPAAWTIDGFCTSKDQPRELDLNLKKLKF